MELREDTTERGRRAAAGLLTVSFGRDLPFFLSPEFDGVTVDEWDRKRERVAADLAAPLWDEVRALLGGGGGYAAVATRLDRLRAFHDRVDRAVAPDELRSTYADRVVDALEEEARRAEQAEDRDLGDDSPTEPPSDTALALEVGDALDESAWERSWWTWTRRDDAYEFAVPALDDEVVSVLRDGRRPSFAVRGGETWGEALERARTEQADHARRAAPLIELRATLRFRAAVVDRLLARYEVLGEVDPLEHYGPQAPAYDPGDVRLVEAAYVITSGGLVGSKSALVRQLMDDLSWRERAVRERLIELGIYRERSGVGQTGTPGDIQRADWRQARTITKWRRRQMLREGLINS